MKKISIIGAIFMSSIYFAQIGVNTPEPKSTFDINAKDSNGSSKLPEGLLIPRVDRQRAQSMDNVVVSTMIYIDDITTGTQTLKTANVDSVGYYFFDGNVWVKLNDDNNSINTHIYNSDGAITSDRIITQSNKKLSFTATQTNAFSVDGTTFSVDAANDRVGIGTSNPVDKLHVVGSVRIADGTQASNRVLTSDSYGRASWRALPNSASKSTVLGYINTASRPVANNVDIGSNITLTTGKWLVHIGQLLVTSAAATTNHNSWVRISLASDAYGGTNGFYFLSTRLVSGWLSPSTVSVTETLGYAFLSGVIPVEVTGSSVTLRTRFTTIDKRGISPQATVGNAGENYLFAIPMN